MELIMRSLFSISEEDKREILEVVAPSAPPEDFITINKEMWQQLSARLDKQEEMMKNLLVEITKNSVKLDELKRINEKQTVIAGMPSVTVPDDKKFVNNSNKPVEITDRSNIETFADGEKNTGEIPDNPETQTKDFPEEHNIRLEKDEGVDLFVDGQQKIEKEILDSWEEIFASIDKGIYKIRYNIGNYKTLDLGKYGVIRMQIAGFDAEELADGSGRAAITWIEMDRLNTKIRMNPKYNKGALGTGSIGGWKESVMRKYIDTEIKPHIPPVVKNKIKSVRKYSCSCDLQGKILSNDISEDEVWIPSVKEVFGNQSYLSEYENNAVYYSSMFISDEARKRDFFWWLRSAVGNRNFSRVNVDGSGNFEFANYPGGLVLGFCT